MRSSMRGHEPCHLEDALQKRGLRHRYARTGQNWRGGAKLPLIDTASSCNVKTENAQGLGWLYSLIQGS